MFLLGLGVVIDMKSRTGFVIFTKFSGKCYIEILGC